MIVVKRSGAWLMQYGLRETQTTSKSSTLRREDVDVPDKIHCVPVGKDYESMTLIVEH